MVKIAAKREGKTLHQKMGEFGTDGIQGPVLMDDQGNLIGTKRLHDTTRKLPDTGPAGANMFNKKLTHFNSQTGKCNIEKAQWSLFSDYWEWMKPKGDELWFTSGRINERWETGFDDERRPYIMTRWPENFVEISPDDAKARGIESGDYVEIYSDRVPGLKEVTLGVEASDYSFSGQMARGNVKLTSAKIKAVAIVTRALKPSVLFMDALNKHEPANALAGRVVDWISGNYNYKMGVARIRKTGVSPYKTDLTAMSFGPRDIVT